MPSKPELRIEPDGTPSLVRSERPERKSRGLTRLIELAERQDDPWIVFSDDKGRGVVHRDDDGEIEVLRLAEGQQRREPEPESEPSEINLADSGHEEASMNHPDQSVNNLTPVREAQRLLGKPVIGSGLEIIKGEGSERFVKTNALNTMLANAGRGGKAKPSSTHRMGVDPRGKGAGKLVAEHLDRAQTQRSKAMGRDSRSRRYRTASQFASD